MPPEEETTPDDMFEQERPDRLEHEVGNESLAEDFDTPAAPDSPASINDDHPTQDTGVDENERYQEGIS